MKWVLVILVIAVASGCGKDQLDSDQKRRFSGQRTSVVSNASVDANCKCRDGGVPVCGRDKVQYENFCVALCKDAQLSNVGECPRERVAGCICEGSREEVCGTDGRTYLNACEADCAGVDVDFAGACDLEETSPTSNICGCPFTRQPVCGSDNLSYESPCVANCFKVSWTDGFCPLEQEVSNERTPDPSVPTRPRE